MTVFAFACLSFALCLISVCFDWFWVCFLAVSCICGFGFTCFGLGALAVCVFRFVVFACLGFAGLRVFFYAMLVLMNAVGLFCNLLGAGWFALYYDGFRFGFDFL